MSPPPAWPRVPDTARPDGGHSGSSGRSIRRSLRLVTTSSTLLKADPAGGRRPPSGPVATRRSPGHRPHRPAQPAPTPHPDRHVVLTRFRACQRERPRPLQAAATGPCGDWGASVSGRQRRPERRLPRRLWRSRWARRFPMAEPACWAISSRKARSGSHRISKRHPASSHHKDRVHTLAPRPTRGIGFNVEPGERKSAPQARDAPRRWPCLGTLRRLQPNSVNRSSHRSS
jgi:hypothetical protein